jgi:cell wall-associated NlpC family hydrolase
MACATCVRDGLVTVTETGLAVVREARKLIGVPFVHMGRTDSGLDCLGLALLARTRAGIRTEYAGDYRRDLDGVDAEAEVRALFPCMDDMDHTAPGDVVLFRLQRPHHLWQHFGIVTDDGRVVIANVDKMRILEHAVDYRWARRAVLRVPAIASVSVDGGVA